MYTCVCVISVARVSIRLFPGSRLPSRPCVSIRLLPEIERIDEISAVRSVCTYLFTYVMDELPSRNKLTK